MDWELILEKCRKDGFCWLKGEYWTLHGLVLWRGCIPYATYDPITGVRSKYNGARAVAVT